MPAQVGCCAYRYGWGVHNWLGCVLASALLQPIPPSPRPLAQNLHVYLPSRSRSQPARRYRYHEIWLNAPGSPGVMCGYTTVPLGNGPFDMACGGARGRYVKVLLPGEDRHLILNEVRHPTRRRACAEKARASPAPARRRVPPQIDPTRCMCMAPSRQPRSTGSHGCVCRAR